MQIQCSDCNSTSVVSKGTVKRFGKLQMRVKCKACGTNSYHDVYQGDDDESIMQDYVPPSSVVRYVITACQNNTTINTAFLESLETYCQFNNAELMIVPIVYRPGDFDSVEYHVPERFLVNFINEKKHLHSEVYVMGSYNFIPTTVNPLSGLESISKGSSLIVPSPQLRMKSLAVSASRHPAVLITTGAISHPEYLNSKIGERAKFNHSYSAVVVEIDTDGDYHIRVLNSDNTGAFYDLDKKYDSNVVTSNQTIECLITGDEHAVFASPEVKSATYTAEDSIVAVLKPQTVVRHDLLDCYSISHHHRRDSILNVGKYMVGKNEIAAELRETVNYLLDTTKGFKNVIVSSNHNDHLTRWLKEVDIKNEPWNAVLYHWLMYKVLSTIKSSDTGISYANPFELYCTDAGVNAKFLKRDESYTIHDIELNAHGDLGINGSRGTIAQYSNLSQKYVIGHSHTPGIVFGAYQVGTSSHLKLEYSGGPSSWMNTHCIVHKNGKRQLINIIKGKWRA